MKGLRPLQVISQSFKMGSIKALLPLPIPLKCLYLFVLLASFSSCDQDSEELEEPKQPPFTAKFGFKKEDLSCDKDHAVDRLGSKVKVWMADKEGKVKLQSFDFSKYSGHSLKRPGVINSTIIYLRRHLGQYNLREHASNIQERGVTTGSYNPYQFSEQLYFCRKNGNYERNSLENSALASLVGIDQAYQAYKDVKKFTMNQGLELPAINLVVHPHVDKAALQRYEGQEPQAPILDNAAWVFLQSNQQKFYEIVAYPHSPSRDTELPSYWEVPLIFAHEYGHHVMNITAPKLLSYKPSMAETKRTILGLDEGFADLFAYNSQYKNQNKSLSQSFHIRSNYEGNRSIEINYTIFPTFSLEPQKHTTVTIYKRFTKQFLALFFDQAFINDQYEATLTERIKDPHHLGAVFAYSFDKLMNAAGFSNAPQVKNMILISWARKLNQVIFSTPSAVSLSGKELLDRSLKLLCDEIYAQMLHYNPDLSNEAKEDWAGLLKYFFPNFAPNWFHPS